MKKVVCTLTIVLALCVMMFAEYRFIMTNLQPTINGEEISIEFMGMVDVYEVTNEVANEVVNEVVNEVTKGV